MVFSVFEILDIAVMTFIIGYLFKDIFKAPREQDILHYYKSQKKLQWNDFWWACALIAPAILIHELGHKFTALGFGLDATFHAACSTQSFVAGNIFTFTCNIQLFAILMKAMGFGFLIFIPAFVATSGNATPLQHALISFAGPLIHLVFWLGIAYFMKDPKRTKRMSNRKKVFLFFFKKVNMFLFILNMLPIPGFDGFWVFMNLFRAVF